MRINTSGYEGNITKRITVNTNDPQKKVTILRVNAFVKTSISVSAKYIDLTGVSGEKITKTVTIISKEDRPLELKPNRFSLEKKVSYYIEEVQKGKTFKIHFTSVPGLTGAYYGFLTLKTNYPEKPEIAINVRAKYQKAGLGKRRSDTKP